QRLAVGVEQGVGHHRELRHARGAGVAPGANQREARLTEQVPEAIAIEVDEAVPLADVDVLETVGAPGPPVTDTLEVLDLARAFLHEQVEVTVTVDVDQLRPGHVETAQERRGDPAAVAIVHGDRVHTRNEPLRTEWRSGSDQCSKQCCEGYGPAHRAPAAPTPVGEEPSIRVLTVLPDATSMIAIQPCLLSMPSMPCMSWPLAPGLAAPVLRLATNR